MPYVTIEPNKISVPFEVDNIIGDVIKKFTSFSPEQYFFYMGDLSSPIEVEKTFKSYGISADVTFEVAARPALIPPHQSMFFLKTSSVGLIPIHYNPQDLVFETIVSALKTCTPQDAIAQEAKELIFIQDFNKNSQMEQFHQNFRVKSLYKSIEEMKPEKKYNEITFEDCSTDLAIETTWHLKKISPVIYPAIPLSENTSSEIRNIIVTRKMFDTEPTTEKSSPKEKTEYAYNVRTCLSVGEAPSFPPEKPISNDINIDSFKKVIVISSMHLLPARWYPLPEKPDLDQEKYPGLVDALRKLGGNCAILIELEPHVLNHFEPKERGKISGYLDKLKQKGITFQTVWPIKATIENPLLDLIDLLKPHREKFPNTSLFYFSQSFEKCEQFENLFKTDQAITHVSHENNVKMALDAAPKNTAPTRADEPLGSDEVSLEDSMPILSQGLMPPPCVAAIEVASCDGNPFKSGYPSSVPIASMHITGTAPAGMLTSTTAKSPKDLVTDIENTLLKFSMPSILPSPEKHLSTKTAPVLIIHASMLKEILFSTLVENIKVLLSSGNTIHFLTNSQEEFLFASFLQKGVASFTRSTAITVMEPRLTKDAQIEQIAESYGLKIRFFSTENDFKKILRGEKNFPENSNVTETLKISSSAATPEDRAAFYRRIQNSGLRKQLEQLNNTEDSAGKLSLHSVGDENHQVSLAAFFK